MLRILLSLLLAGHFLSLFQTYAIGEDLPEITLRGELPPVRATYEDILKLDNDISEIILKANKDNPKSSTFGYITYEVDGREGSLKGEVLAELLKNPRLPTKAIEYKFTLSLKSSSVKTVRIWMFEISSPWEISGTEPLYLDALRNRIEAFGQEHATWMGGLLVQILLLALAILTVVGILASAVESASTKHAISAIKQFIIGISIGAFAVYQFASLNVRYGFPRTAIYRGSSSFIERYSAEIGFWGLILTVVGIVVTVIFSKKRPEKENLSKSALSQSNPPTDSSKNA
jgi:hypothetical protein